MAREVFESCVAYPASAKYLPKVDKVIHYIRYQSISLYYFYINDCFEAYHTKIKYWKYHVAEIMTQSAAVALNIQLQVPIPF